MPDGTLYNTDFHAWAIEQAELLRAISQRNPPELVGIDLEHIIEEVEDLGREARNKVESLWFQALLHFMKIALDPECNAVRHWRKEINAMLSQARRHYRASMEQYIDVDDLWVDASRDMRRDRKEDQLPAVDIPSRCPLTLHQLADSEYDLDDLLHDVLQSFSSSGFSYN